ncbi:MAG TPA: ankyrin repeat domain-containing protein, partial [Gemmataceae bacterium]|nr:ankyrin repeat domain-containing protein [Gemmataceae bacterium]
QPARAESPVADAAEKGDWSRVRALLKDKADANAAQVDGMTALHWAAFHDDTNAAKHILAAGGNAKAANRYGVTPLSLACMNGNAGIIRALLAAGADANGALRGGETALMTASRTGKVGPVKALLDAGAKVDAKDRKGQTALMWAAAEGHAAVIELLVKSGADVKVRTAAGFTPLLFAARDGRTAAVHALLQAGADANDAIKTERAVGGFGARNGTSALIFAVENAHFELALELVKSGANPNDERSGFTPLHTLTWVRKPSRGDDPDGQPPPTGSGTLTSLQFARKLIAAGADVNRRLEKGTSGRGKLSTTAATAFLLASKTADLPYMKLLVELGADPKLANKDGCTPLMAAAGIGTLAPTEEAGTEDEAVAAVEYLLELGADVNAVDKNGETAMHGAAYKSLPKMVQLLADRGAKIDVWNKKNKYDWTPLVIAEGFRPGNFKPSVETVAAIHRVMKAAGVTPPPPTPRPAATPAEYDKPEE